MKLRTINHILTSIAAVLALYIIIFPFSPEVTWWVKHNTPLHSHASVAPPIPSADKKPNRPPGNTLIVPRLDMKQEIFDGSTMYTLRKGLWHRPNTSNPAHGGNTVIVGHRFTYSGPAIFYHLDKIQVGDPITVYWQHQRYDYVVTTKKVVPPSTSEIEANTKNPMLTLYSCTPLWSAKDRLVIQAKLTEHIQ